MQNAHAMSPEDSSLSYPLSLMDKPSKSRPMSITAAPSRLQATDQRTVAAVLAIGTAMATTHDHAQMLGAVIDAVCTVIDATTGGFMRHDPAQDELVLQAPAFGVHAEATVALYRVSVADGGNAARVFLSREPYITHDAQADPRFIQRFVRLFDTRNTITVPLVLRDRAVGIFHAINKRSGDFTPADRNAISWNDRCIRTNACSTPPSAARASTRYARRCSNYWGVRCCCWTACANR